MSKLNIQLIHNEEKETALLKITCSNELAGNLIELLYEVYLPEMMDTGKISEGNNTITVELELKDTDKIKRAIQGMSRAWRHSSNLEKINLN